MKLNNVIFTRNLEFMRINKGILFAASLLVSFAHAETLEFPKAGFSIASLDSSPTLGIIQPIQMLLPAKNGFSANVNVQVQAYSGTMQEYKDLSEGQFKLRGLTVLYINEQGNSLTFEYRGKMQSLSLHWYAKAFKKGDHIYLATATSTEDDWELNKEQLMSNVNSFKLSK